MAQQFTFKKTPDGNIEVSQDGKRIATTSEKFARTKYGYTGDLTLPTEAQPAQTLPDTGEPSNNLLTFRDTLSKVTDLARNKRNQSFLKFAMPFRGTTAASDFSGILSNLNRASERFTTEATERLLPDETLVATAPAPDPTDIFKVDISTATAKELKTEVKDTFSREFANQIIEDFNDEQLREFLRDYELTRNELQNVAPEIFLREWKAELGLDKKTTSRTP